MSKPAGWIDEYEFYTNEQYDEFDEELRDGLIPLYKHPSKQLTDDEIESIGRDTLDVEFFDEGEYGMQFNIYGMVAFAREILRKAQA